MSKVLGPSRGPHINVRETKMYYRDSRKFFYTHRVVRRWNRIVWIKKWQMHLVSMPSRGDLIN